MSSDFLLETRGVSKRFGSVQALRNTDFTVGKKEIVGLVGDNGAGKSTLLKIIAGNYEPDEGEIWFEGKKVSIKSPQEAKVLGIETVYQDLALCENLDVTANYFLGRELTTVFNALQESRMRRQTGEVLRNLDIDITSVDKIVQFLSGGQRQAIAVGRAASWGAKLLLLDEPTSSLGIRESHKVLNLIRRLREERGLGVVIISHNLQHVLPVADRIVILRQGQQIGSCRPSEKTYDEVVKMISGMEAIHLRE